MTRSPSNVSAHALIQQVTQHGAVIFADAGRVRITGASKLPSPLLEQLKNNREDVLAALTVPRLPWQLERLIGAASSHTLDLTISGTPDANRYVCAWACEYLVSSQKEEPLKRLWEVYELWQPQQN
jgi:hypothetical protein